MHGTQQVWIIKPCAITLFSFITEKKKKKRFIFSHDGPRATCSLLLILIGAGRALHLFVFFAAYALKLPQGVLDKSLLSKMRMRVCQEVGKAR